MPRSRSAPLDGLRALAALSVLAYHSLLATAGLGAASGALHFGVPVFFVLSGLLLYRPFVAARMDGAPPPRLRSYAVRRAARIVPAYWTALLALGALGLV